MGSSLLGIDIGSSTVKAALFEDGRQVAVARVPCVSDGDFRPERWWTAVRGAVVQLDCRAVEAVGVCGRGGTGVLLGAQREVLATSWNDGREREDLRGLRKERPDLSPQGLALLARANWWRRREKVALAFTAKDYVNYRMTGALGTDPASGGASTSDCAPLLRAQPPWSRLGATLSGALPGVRSGLPVAVGWHDGAAATFGSGASEEGAAPVTLGTHAVYRIVATALPAGLPTYWDLTSGLVVTGGDIRAAGTAFAWAREILQSGDAGRAPPGANGVLFLPQLAGRIGPTRNAAAHGAWLGLEAAHSADDLLRAVLEGTALALRQVREWLGDHGLIAVRTVATGAGAHNPLQAQVLADVLQQAVAVAGCEEGCRGAALLAGVAAGRLQLDEARRSEPEYRLYAPNVSLAALYDSSYQRFRAAQDATDRVWQG